MLQSKSDDVLVIWKTKKEHSQNLQEVLSCLESMVLDKSQFLAP